MLKEYLSKLADAIRSELGGTDPINAREFPDKIWEVYEAGRQKKDKSEFCIENHNATGVSISYTSVEDGQVVVRVAESGFEVNDSILCGGMLVLVTLDEGFEPTVEGFKLVGKVHGDNVIVYTYRAPDSPDDCCSIDF